MYVRACLAFEIERNRSHSAPGHLKYTKIVGALATCVHVIYRLKGKRVNQGNESKKKEKRYEKDSPNPMTCAREQTRRRVHIH